MNVFRTATGQAIRDIISDHGTANRFGISLTDSDLDAVCERIVDLFEMTLNLRAQLGTGASPESRSSSAPVGRFSQPVSTVKPRRWEEEPASVPKTKAASEVFDFSHLEKTGRADALPVLAPQSEELPDLKLPRKRIMVTGDEKELLARRSQAPTVALSRGT